MASGSREESGCLYDPGTFVQKRLFTVEINEFNQSLCLRTVENYSKDCTFRKDK